jgi:hypothetical protein
MLRLRSEPLEVNDSWGCPGCSEAKKGGYGNRQNNAGKIHPRNYSWAELMKRVFGFDVLKCDSCGGRMRILCAINPPAAIKKILDCLGLPSRPPPDGKNNHSPGSLSGCLPDRSSQGRPVSALYAGSSSNQESLDCMPRKHRSPGRRRYPYPSRRRILQSVVFRKPVLSNNKPDPGPCLSPVREACRPLYRE